MLYHADALTVAWRILYFPPDASQTVSAQKVCGALFGR